MGTTRVACTKQQQPLGAAGGYRVPGDTLDLPSDIQTAADADATPVVQQTMAPGLGLPSWCWWPDCC